MTLYGVSFEPIGKQPIVLLKTLDEERFLPIWIGHPEAAAILMKLQGASPPRPMTHDLLASRLGAQGRGGPGDRDRAAREHVLREDHDRPGRQRGRDRLPPLGRDRPRSPLRGADLRSRRCRRGVGESSSRPETTSRSASSRRRTSRTSIRRSSASSSRASLRRSSPRAFGRFSRTARTRNPTTSPPTTTTPTSYPAPLTDTSSAMPLNTEWSAIPG